MKLKFIVAALGTLMVSQSFAQSVFEGPFVQGALGYTNVSPKFNETLTVGQQTASPQNINADNLSVLTGNVGAGYNFLLAPKFLLGVSVDFMPIASGSAKTTVSFPKLPDVVLPSSIPGSYQMKNPYNISIIPGYELSKAQVIYGKVSYTGATVIYSDSVTPATSANMSGYTLGLGYKQALENQLYVFAEGLYTKFQDQTVSMTGPAGITNFNLTAGASGYTLLVGVGYRF